MTPIEASEAPPLGTLVAGRYRLERFLGAGGMGAVYEAPDHDGTRVAVKVLLESVRTTSNEVVERFRREAEVSSALDSPHIVRALDAGVDLERHMPFMVMPLMVGMDLEALIERFGPIHPTLAVRIVRQACVALDVAHRSAVIHRDIKPANLFLDHAPDGSIRVRVLDFGIAKWTRDSATMTATGSVMGTPVFMAPEQMVDAKRVDARSDVWSAGMTLYNALSGSVPFVDTVTSWVELATAITQGDIPPLQEVAPWVDPGLARIVHGTLLKDPEARCPSARELHRALAPFAYGGDELTSTMLQPLAQNIRQHRAPLSELPQSWQLAMPERPAPLLTLIDADPLLGKTLGGRYVLLRSLGEGGMGAVYESTGPDGGRLAVKIIRPELAGTSPSARRRFVREAKVVQSIDSPHVVRILDVDSDPQHELPFIAMELLHGSDLDQLIKQRGALDAVTCARLFIQASRGLSAAHARGFVHRDVKPANLFLNRQPNGEVIVKLCDFGIVKQLDATGVDATNLTRTGGVIGSPMYMSPEQATNSKNIDERSDIWSLGAALYEALSGCQPWAGKESVGELILAVCTQPLVHVQDRAPWVPTGLAEVVHRAMSRYPAERYQTMEELISALRPFTRDRTAVMENELRPVSDKERAVVAQRAQTSSAATMASSSGAASVPSGGYAASAEGIAHTVTPAQPRGRGVLIAALAALALAAAGGAAVWFRPANVPPPEEPATVTAAEPSSAAPEPTTAPVAAPVTHRARVTIQPPTASVTVNGAEAQLEDGALVLEGEPGDSFIVAVRIGARSIERTVAITKEGKPSLASIELPAAGRPPPAGLPAPPSSAGKAPPAQPDKPGSIDEWK